MKLIDGKYTITNPNAAQAAINRKNGEIAVMQAQLNLVGQWAREQLKLHQPYTHRLDISCANPENMVDILLDKIRKDLWCSLCSNPWPCKHIANLQLLRRLSHSQDLDSIQELVDRMGDRPEPAKRDGQLDVGL